MLPGFSKDPGSVFTERQVQFLLRRFRPTVSGLGKGLANKAPNMFRGLVHYVFIRLPAFYGAGNPDDYLLSNFLTSAATVAPL